VFSEGPFAVLPEQGLVFMPMYYAGSIGPDGRVPSEHPATGPD
jgi:hypothetical protein